MHVFEKKMVGCDLVETYLRGIEQHGGSMVVSNSANYVFTKVTRDGQPYANVIVSQVKDTERVYRDGLAVQRMPEGVRIEVRDALRVIDFLMDAFNLTHDNLPELMAEI